MTSARERYEVLARLERAGITPNDAEKLRRIALTLHRWSELECGVDNGCVERDETTGKTYWLNSTTGHRYPVRDRETGALKRLKAIMHPYRRKYHAYYQSDPRGAALWLVRRKDLPKGADINGYYSRGVAIY
jgi:hypothetical protein